MVIFDHYPRGRERLPKLIEYDDHQQMRLWSVPSTL
jgi:hypothetical protein